MSASMAKGITLYFVSTICFQGPSEGCYDFLHFL